MPQEIYTLLLLDHFTFCLKCKQKCKGRLSNLRDLPDNPHMLTQMYFYLMYAYYKGQSVMSVSANIPNQITNCLFFYQLVI